MNPVNAAWTEPLRALLRGQEIAALGTLHDGAPYVSMVPFALLPDASRIVIHVSSLAAHTRDMLADPRVSLLVVAPPAPDVTAQATARVTIQGRAEPCADGTGAHASAQAAYLARFPASAQTFGFADFSLFAIVPESLSDTGLSITQCALTPAALAELLSTAFLGMSWREIEAACAAIPGSGALVAREQPAWMDRVRSPVRRCGAFPRS
jgi:nitroimidazol reductase NimA-like FMN-containing flavoprotein (pyridoxamine 5'-phosphate oxidase superfamily)